MADTDLGRCWGWGFEVGLLQLLYLGSQVVVSPLSRQCQRKLPVLVAHAQGARIPVVESERRVNLSLGTCPHLNTPQGNE